MNKGKMISTIEAIRSLVFLPDRTPSTTEKEAEDAFAELANYRDGSVYVGYYAGNSAWERHHADELVMALGGRAIIILLHPDRREERIMLTQGQLIVVPELVWHRFEVEKELKVMTITPQPTDHSFESPI